MNKGIISPDAEQVLKKVEWNVLKRLDGLLRGDYRTLFHGFGLDLTDLVEYQFGDDVRYIEWNTTARLGVPYVRQFNEDRNISAWFVVDMSNSMSFGSGERSKCDVAREFIAALMSILSRHGNRCGAIIFDEKVREVHGPRAGRKHILRILQALRCDPVRQDGNMTSLSGQLLAVAASLSRRSLVFVISDFISATSWGEALGQLAMRHEVIAVRLIDPLEIEFPDLGMLTLRDAETGEQIWVDSSDAHFRHRFAAEAAFREERIAADFYRAGVDAIELSTDESILNTLLRFVHLRDQLRYRSNKIRGYR